MAFWETLVDSPRNCPHPNLARTFMGKKLRNVHYEQKDSMYRTFSCYQTNIKTASDQHQNNIITTLPNAQPFYQHQNNIRPTSDHIHTLVILILESLMFVAATPSFYQTLSIFLIHIFTNCQAQSQSILIQSQLIVLRKP